MALLAMLGLSACTTTTVLRSYLTPLEALARAIALAGTRMTVGGVLDLGTSSPGLYDSMEAIRVHNGDGSRVLNPIRRRSPL